MSVHSKLALITGATKGIGHATARLAAREGMTVFATGRDTAQLQALAEEIEQDAGTCYTFAGDLSNDTDRVKLAEAVAASGRETGLIVHSAGVARVGSIATFDTAAWQENLDVNLTAPFRLTQLLLPLLKNGSHLFFLNSVAGRTTFPDWAGYSASKWGLRAFADTLRGEVARSGIKVTTVYPAAVDTPMQDSLPYDWDRTKMLHADDVARIILQTYQQPEAVVIPEIDLQNMAGTF
jgi:NADP-dependent 3-hydroxy acid dehydrogenase YdfG